MDMDFDIGKMHEKLAEQHKRTAQYWEWVISEGPCEPPLDNIREAVEALLAVESEILAAFKQGRPDLSEKGMASAQRLENRAYHFITHNLLNQVLERVKRLESGRP
jgi:hypothetical protein